MKNEELIGFSDRGAMLEEASDDALDKIKKLDQLMRTNVDFDEFKSILTTMAPAVVRITRC